MLELVLLSVLVVSCLLCVPAVPVTVRVCVCVCVCVCVRTFVCLSASWE